MQYRRKPVKGMGVAWADGQGDYKMKSKQELLKCCEVTFVDLPVNQLYLTLPGVREGWATGVQPWRILREAGRNGSLRQEGLLCLQMFFLWESFIEEGARERPRLPLGFLLEQVTGNAARSGSSLKPLCTGGGLRRLYLHILNDC